MASWNDMHIRLQYAVTVIAHSIFHAVYTYRSKKQSYIVMV